MRNVRVMRWRYFIFGLAAGFLCALLAIGLFLASRIIENDLLSLLGIFWNSVSQDIGLWQEFLADINEFVPWRHLVVWIICLIIFLILMAIVIIFRKALFAKVENFSKNIYGRGKN